MEQQAREQAFITALTTEQFVLQAARSANVGEMTGRGTIYMGAVSSSLIALGFLAQVVTHLDPFVAAVLPAVFLLGEFTFAALVRNTLENLVLLRQMQRIRGYYRTLVPEADQFFGQAAEAERSSAAMATVGLRAWPAGMLFTGASVIAAINQRVPPSHGSTSMEQQAREQAFISALTTEQFVLHAARSANVAEMTGRATVYMGVVSGSESDTSRSRITRCQPLVGLG